MATADALAQRLLDLVRHQPDTEFAAEGHFVIRLLAHRDDDGIAPEAKHQPRPLRLQVHDDTRLVLPPEIARTRRAAGLTRLGPWYQTRLWHLRLGG